MTSKKTGKTPEKKPEKPAQDAGFFMGDEKAKKPYKVRDAQIATGGSYTIVDGKAILNETKGA